MQYGAIVPINILRPCPIDNSTRDWHPIEFNSMTTRFRCVDHCPDWFLLSIWCSCNIGASTKYMSMVKWMRPQERSMCIKCEMVSVCVCECASVLIEYERIRNRTRVVTIESELSMTKGAIVPHGCIVSVLWWLIYIIIINNMG